MTQTVFDAPGDLLGKEGLKIGPSDWMEISQGRINTFADATGDHQWIHIDEEKAKHGPFGTTIAHGYLTLSLAAKLMPEILKIKGMKMGINYGTDKVRFLNPVKSGSKVRGHGEFLEIKEIIIHTDFLLGLQLLLRCMQTQMMQPILLLELETWD